MRQSPGGDDKTSQESGESCLIHVSFCNGKEVPVIEFMMPFFNLQSFVGWALLPVSDASLILSKNLVAIHLLECTSDTFGDRFASLAVAVNAVITQS